MIVPASLVAACSGSSEQRDWLERLPALVADLAGRWSISVEADRPFVASAAWVAPAVAGATPAVLKLSMPHMEAEGEIDGLRFWAGEPTVALLDAEPAWGAMLLERCVPGVPLTMLPEPEQDRVITDLLRRLWRRPGDACAFRPLSALVSHWCAETRAAEDRWAEPPLVRRGLRHFDELAETSTDTVLLATDLHAGNVLSAERAPLVTSILPLTSSRHGRRRVCAAEHQQIETRSPTGLGTGPSPPASSPHRGYAEWQHCPRNREAIR